MMELADIADLKSVGCKPCRFESDYQYHFSLSFTSIDSRERPAIWRVGRVRLIAPVSKTGGGDEPPVGSNPTLAVNILLAQQVG